MNNLKLSVVIKSLFDFQKPGGKIRSCHPVIPRHIWVVLLAWLNLLNISGLFAQVNSPIASSSAQVHSSVMKSMEWRLIGPFRGGRSVTVAGDPADRLVAYMGTTGGGVWKTVDGGISWQNISDGFMKSGSVGAIAVSPSHRNIIYVGMGEHTLRGNSINGDGVYKSVDSGKTWKYMGLKETHHIGRVIIDPANPDIVYIAALGHEFGPNAERGVFRTKDGGKSWSKILYINDNAGAVDLTIDPSDTKVLYASAFEFRRYPWGVRSAGPGAGIYKTVDGGDTWKNLTTNPGLPTGVNRGRIGIALSPSYPKRLWAIIEAENDQTGVYRTDDAGANWHLMSQFAELSQRPWYYHHITADPKDSSTVWIMNIGMWKSSDGGKKYTRVNTPHGDNHDLWIDPADTKHMVQANDGGGTVTYDGGRSWSTIYNQPTAQMYHVITDNKFPFRVYGSQQDNTTISVPSRSDYGSIFPNEYYEVGGGESGYIAFNKNDPTVIYAANHHWLTKMDLRTNQVNDISVIPDDMYGYGSADLKYRFQWTFPVMVSPNNPNVLYATSQYVHRSTDKGHSWEVISPNLSRSDPSTLEKTPTLEDSSIGKYWGPVKRDNTGVEWYGTIFALAESPVKPGVLWSGSDDGFIHVSRDNGKSWQKVTPADMPEFARVSIIEPSAFDPATAYVAAMKYQQDDMSPYVFKTNDYGKTWKKIINGFAREDFARVVREDPKRKGLLYAGTQNGMYVSFNDGDNWQTLQLNLPIVPIHDLAVQDNNLVAATHGRSFWILDDLSVLRQSNPGIQQAEVHLFKPDKTIRFKGNREPAIRPVPGEARYLGKNPPNGVIVTYFLKEKPKGDITMEFVDASGKSIKTYTSKRSGGKNLIDTTAVQAPPDMGSDEAGPGRKPEPVLKADKGSNKFVWEDMRYPAPVSLPGAVTHGTAKGPLALPGIYQVRLKVDGKAYTQSFEITTDPRLQTRLEEFKEQFDLQNKIVERINELRSTVIDLRTLRARLDSLQNTTLKMDVAGMLETKNQLLHIEDALVQFRAKATQDLTNYPVRLNTKLTVLSNFVDTENGRPTKQQVERYNILSKKLAEQVQKFKVIKEKIQISTRQRST